MMLLVRIEDECIFRYQENLSWEIAPLNCSTTWLFLYKEYFPNVFILLQELETGAIIDCMLTSLIF